ncbi:hypothetical protein JTB14_016922 [Gonioctena quinquepunctata]|nr:hypothetical protein JTB14_016922 [Gonioctena quinquepunctata]
MIFVGIMKLEFSNAFVSYLYKIWSILIQSCYLLFCASFFIGLRSVSADQLLRDDELTYLWTFIMIWVKLIFSQTDTMVKVIEELFKLERRIDKDKGVQRKYLEHSRYNFKIFWGLATIYFGTLCQLFWLMKYNWANKSLFFTSWFPFDASEYYTMTLIFQVVSGIIITMYTLTFDTLFTAIILFPSMLLDILGYKFEHFWDFCKKTSEDPKLVLRKMILEHKKTIRYVEELDASLKWFFFIDFLVKSYHLSMMIITIVAVSIPVTL